MYVHYRLSQYDKRQRLLSASPPSQSRSFVKAFLQLVYMLMSDASSENIIDITNTSRNFDDEADAYTTVMHPGLDSKSLLLLTNGFSSGGGGNIVDTPPWDILSDDCGIVIGTSSTAVAVADDNLVAPIEHGSTSGKMVHYGCYGLNYTTGASSASFDVERIFRNDSGGSIVVAEIGMYAASGIAPGTNQGSAYCILRDVLGATVTVLNGEYLKVKYTITVSN